MRIGVEVACEGTDETEILEFRVKGLPLNPEDTLAIESMVCDWAQRQADWLDSWVAPSMRASWCVVEPVESGDWRNVEVTITRNGVVE